MRGLKRKRKGRGFARPMPAGKGGKEKGPREAAEPTCARRHSRGPSDAFNPEASPAPPALPVEHWREDYHSVLLSPAERPREHGTETLLPVRLLSCAEVRKIFKKKMFQKYPTYAAVGRSLPRILP